MDNGTSIIIDLAVRYAAAFGIVKASEMMAAVSLTKEDNKYQVDFFDDWNESNELIKIQDQTGNDLLKFGSVLIGNTSAVFAPPMMLFFRREKDLVETSTNGEDNVIVERWGTKPWEIQMRGLLIDVENRQYPSSQISELNKLFSRNEILMVAGSQFYDKGISHIYFKDLSITPLEGFGDTVQFDFTASAIKENTWTLDEPNQ